MATVLRRATFPLLGLVLFAAALLGQTPAPAQATAQTPAPRPETAAFTAAMAIREPGEKRAALEKIRADFPQAINITAVDGQILTVLASNWPDRLAEIATVFDRIIGRIAPDAGMSVRLTQTINPVNIVIGKKLLLDRSEQVMTAAVAALDEAKYRETRRSNAKLLKQPEPTEQVLKADFGQERSRGLELLARIHAARGDATKAEAFYKEAVDANPAFGAALTSLVDIYVGRKEFDKAEAVLNASIKAATTPALAARATMALADLFEKKGDEAKWESVLKDAAKMTPPPAGVYAKLAKLEARRGNDANALDMFVTAAATTNLSAADDAIMRALYRKVRGGSDAALEDLIDKTYNEKFPNPVKPRENKPLPNRTNRLVLLEMFTGSGCGPCVAADLAFDAVMEHYPAGTIVPIAYHENIPVPDPMVTAATNERINYYGRRAVPTFTIDGGPGRVGGGGRPNAQAAYDDYITKIDKALQTPATAALSISATGSGDHITVTTHVTELPADTKDLRLHILLVEKHLRFMGENRIRFHPMVVRAAVGFNGTGVPITTTGQTVHTFSLNAIKEDITNTLKAEIDRRRSLTSGAQFAAEGRPYVAIDTDALVAIAFIQQGAYRGGAPTGPVAGVDMMADSGQTASASGAPRPAAGGPLSNVLQATMADVKFSASRGKGQ